MAARGKPRRAGDSGMQDAGPSQRQLRVAESLRHALSDVFRRGDFRDPELDCQSVTVTEVRVSPDLKNATAFVMPLGGGGETRTQVVKALTRAQPFIRRQVGELVTLRSTPKFSFQIDLSFDQADMIDRALKNPNVARDLDRAGLEKNEVSGTDEDEG